jgi:hypothetical protein
VYGVFARAFFVVVRIDVLARRQLARGGVNSRAAALSVARKRGAVTLPRDGWWQGSEKARY